MANRTRRKSLPRRRTIPAFLGFLLLCFLVSAIGGWVTAGSVKTWYPLLEKPPHNPPAWVFGPVWTVLYILMATAAWRVWRAAGWVQARPALILFFAQLGLNLLWSVLFFGLRNPTAALVEIVLLLAAILATMRVFRPIDQKAFWMFVPYALWVGYAATLNAGIVYLN